MMATTLAKLNVRTYGYIFKYKSSLPNVRLFSAVTDKDKDVEKYFIRSDVQNILKRITGFNLDKIFRERKVDDIAEPKYKLLTTSQLQEHTVEAVRRGQELLQMPPVKRPWTNESTVLAVDNIANFEPSNCRYIFTDITYGVSHRHRTVTIREPDGTLRFANPEEKDRLLHVYFPRPGKMPKMPAMFEETRLEKILGSYRYEYVLDRACVQFEPDDPHYIRVTHRTYEHICNHGRYDDLRSTRHFGPMAFYLAFSCKIDGLLVDMLQRGLLKDAGDLVRLHHVLNPDRKSAAECRSRKLSDPQQLVSLFAELDSTGGGRVQLALQAYLDSEQDSVSLSSA